MTKQFFNEEELPPGFIMAITKLPTGEELATIFRIDDTVERKIKALTLLTEMLEAWQQKLGK